jgi:hypothetical protein
MRWYTPYWEQLKTNGVLELDLPPTEHNRLVRAIRKESYRDKALRLRCTVSIEVYRNRRLLKFTLTTHEILS